MIVAAATLVGCREQAPSSNAPSRETPMPGPGAARGLPAAQINAGCEGCHADEAAEWRGSLHQLAHLDESYQRAFAIEPMAFCQSCHAPEADPEGIVDEPIAAIGVGCVTCHQIEGGVLAGAHARSEKLSPHPLVRSAAFADRAGCATCHEFAFPGIPGRERQLMQSTLSEGAASPLPGARCESCHMPREGDHASHRFNVARDPEAVRGAVTVSVERTGTSVRITLAPKSIGHAFPTGDLFRRLELSAEVVGADQAVLAEERRYLARHFGEVRGSGQTRALLGDDRVGLHGADPSRVELTLGPRAKDRPIAVRVAYQRVAHPRGIDESTAVVDDEIVLHESTLSP